MTQTGCSKASRFSEMKQIQIIKNFINEELTGWKTWEISWLIACCIVIAAVSLNLKDTWMGITAAVTGNIYVICTGKGKRCAFLFGTVNVILYALISWEAKFYGEVMLNALYYLPMQFWGFYIWNKNLSNTTHEVHKKRMTGKLRALYASAIILASILYGLILKLIGGSLPFADAFTTAASVAALLMSVKMYMEQWIVWIAVDVLTIIMWGIA
nr:nicotinamide riboside transporter PnuC [bacterium]